VVAVHEDNTAPKSTRNAANPAKGGSGSGGGGGGGGGGGAANAQGSRAQIARELRALHSINLVALGGRGLLPFGDARCESIRNSRYKYVVLVTMVSRCVSVSTWSPSVAAVATIWRCTM
jgi:hypothetical protein